jgi:hypothetical protein
MVIAFFPQFSDLFSAGSVEQKQRPRIFGALLETGLVDG